MDTVEMHERVATLENDKKSVHRRLDNLEKLVESVHTIATETKAMREDMNNYNERLKEIEQRPYKRYDTFITAVITAIAGGIIGYFINFFK